MKNQRTFAPRTGWRRRVWMMPLVVACATAWGADPPADGGSARGVLRATAEATLSSSVSEKILSMPLREGERFKQGDVLVAFDCRRLEAELRAARAGAAVEARNAKVQTELLRMAATGRADADIARFKQQERQAQADVIQQRMVDCKVVAPYAGSVVETLARLDETPPPNEKLISIVSDGPMELHMVVPSKWLAWLKEGSSLDFIVDETGDVMPAKVTRVSAAVDAVSQTVKVVARVDQAPVGVRPGMSGRATLEGIAAPLASSPAAGTPAAGTPAAGMPAAGTPAAGMPAAGTPKKSPVQAVYQVPAGSDGMPAITPIPSAQADRAPKASLRVGAPSASPLFSVIQASDSPMSGLSR